jgi:tetratricopeptide (TPR) repeat protein/serine/threonine protein kinase
MCDMFADAKRIFLEALEHPGGEALLCFLDEACGGDAGLRARVDELLLAHRDAGSFLEPPAYNSVVMSDGPSIPESSGAVIGPYKLLEPIGEGGFGVVFMAEQTQPVRRKVALKVLKPGMDTRQVVARFEAERQALALMDHPHIAKVLDGGATSSGRPYFVMELVKGVPITEFCDQNHLTLRQRLELFVPVCQAVQHAHQKGIIHRDLKPSNILVVMHDTTPVPAVIDFGIAKALGQELTDKTLFTGFAQMIGTPLYMSPEQAGQSGLDIDTRSDIYSLGVLLYELLTGKTPFAKERFRQAGYEEIRRIIREEEPPKPSTRLSEAKDTLPSISALRQTEPTKLTKLVRGELDWIVMKCLEKDRNRRYETANGLALDVQRYLNDEPVQACPPSAGYRLRKFVRRNKGKLAVAVSLFVAVTVMAASVGWTVRDTAAREAEAQQREAGRLIKVADHVRESLDSARALIAENNWPSAHGKLVLARSQLGNDRSKLPELHAEIEAGRVELDRYQRFLYLVDQSNEETTAPRVDPTLAADVSPGKAGSRSVAAPAGRRGNAWVFFLRRALQCYAVLKDDNWLNTLRVRFLGPAQVENIRIVVYEAMLLLAEDILLRKRGHGTERTVSPQAAAQQALIYLAKAEQAHRPTKAFYVLRGDCHQALDEKVAAQADANLAQGTRATIALDLYRKGQEALAAKQLPEAVRAFEAALRLQPSSYWSLMKLGHCLCDLGRGPEDFEGAIRVFTGCILKRPDHAHAYSCRAIACCKLRRNQEAVADCSQAIELDPRNGTAWGVRGMAYNRQRQYREAIADLTTAIRLNPTGMADWFNRGIAHNALGQAKRAVADFSRAIELAPAFAPAWRNRGLAHDDLGQTPLALADFIKATELDSTYTEAWKNRGVAHAKLNQLPQALSDFSRAIELDPSMASAWFNRGVANHQMGKPAQAIADCARAIDLAPNDPTLVEAFLLRALAQQQLGRFGPAVTDFESFLRRVPAHHKAQMTLARLLATCPEAQWRNPGRAVEAANKAVRLAPREGYYWMWLGVAHYRAGDPKAAVAALDKSSTLQNAWAPIGWLFLAMAHHQQGHPDEARKAYQRTIVWQVMNQKAIDKYREFREEFRRFRAEAEEVLGVKKK